MATELSTAAPPVDAQFPVIYQMMKAEVQNLLDKMDQTQIQQVIETARRIREESLQSQIGQENRNLSESTEKPSDFRPKGEDLEANQLVTELAARRKGEMSLLRTLSNRAPLQPQEVPLSLEAEILPIIWEDSEDESKFSIQSIFDQSSRLRQSALVNAGGDFGGLVKLNIEPNGVGGATLESKSRKSIKIKKPDIEELGAVKSLTDLHVVPLQELQLRLGTCKINGLTSSQVASVLQRDGPNVLTPTKTEPTWWRFLVSLVSGFGSILWGASLLCILAYWPLGAPNPDPYNLFLATVLILVVFVQGTFSFVQQQKASNLIAGFSSLMPSVCRTIRDGACTLISVRDLVVGDIVSVKEGDKLPADLRIFEANEAKLEKSSLTGESEPVPVSTIPTDLNIYETHNMALFGTSLIEGNATGIVINTGDRTVMGKIARVASSAKSKLTGLQKEIHHFLNIICSMALVTCVLMIVGFYLGIKPYHPHFMTVSIMITNAIAVLVGLLPDGLPISVTTILTLIGRRLHKVNILVKKLTVTETLGSATLIASDKTGTITMNRMALNHIWLGNANDSENRQPHLVRRTKSLVYDESCIDPLEKSLAGCYNFENMGKSVLEPAMAFLLQAMALCNKSFFDTGPVKLARKAIDKRNRKVAGNPTEGALLSAADGFFDVQAFRNKLPMVDEIPFNSRRKFHLTIHQVTDRSVLLNSELMLQKQPSFLVDQDSILGDFQHILLVKGAPEYVLSMCNLAVFDNKPAPLISMLLAQVMRANERLALQGERVLAFAYKRLSAEKFPLGCAFDLRDQGDELASDLCFLGLVGIIDPPKPGVAEAIEQCHAAGVRVMMVTGDQSTTAVAIARAVNIITNRQVKTMSDVTSAVPRSLIDPMHTDVSSSIRRQSIKGKFYRLTRRIGRLFSQNQKRQFLNESIVMTGNDLASLSRIQWDYVLSHKEIVFARTTPQQKLQIVQEAQRRGDVIAVTGDGVNDAPALKAADLGVAMGICGSDISKEAANMVLLDDNFTTIVRGIAEGRLLFENLKKVVCYLLPAGTFSEILPVLAFVFAGLPQPLSAFLMIVICVGTDMCGSLGLVHEKAELDIMKRPPRNTKSDRLLTWKIFLFTYGFVGMLESSIAFFMYFFTMYLGNVPPSRLIFAFESWGQEFNHTILDRNGTVTETMLITRDDQDRLLREAQTAFFVSLVMTQLWNLVSVRTRFQSSLRQSFDSRLLLHMLGELMIVLIICYLPFFNINLSTAQARWYHFAIPAILGSLIFIFDEIRKFCVRTWPEGWFAYLAW